MKRALIGIVQDLLVLGGLSMLGLGLWWHSPPLSLVVVGAILMAAGWSFTRGTTTRPRS